MFRRGAPGEGRFDAVLARADRALCAAKDAGRNRVHAQARGATPLPAVPGAPPAGVIAASQQPG